MAEHSRRSRRPASSFNSVMEIGATWNPRCSSATTRPSEESRLRISRSVLIPASYVSRKPSSLSFRPGASLPKTMSARMLR